MLEWTSYTRPKKPPLDKAPWKGPEDTPSIKAVKKYTVRKAPVSLSSSVVTVLCRPGMKVNDAIM